MTELTIEQTIEVKGGVLPLAAIAVGEAISLIGGAAGIVAWLMSD